MSGDDDNHSPAVQVGISAGALVLSLADLRYQVSLLADGSELRDTWEQAVNAMDATLEVALQHHRASTGQRPLTTPARRW